MFALFQPTLSPPFPTHPLVHMQQWLVAHVQRAHELKGRDLKREVEGSDDGHRAIWPAMASGVLACMVARVCEATCEEAHLWAWSMVVHAWSMVG